ncbi:MAG: hypothetical protein M3020_08265 [Myxococcota bacterium]|nr:hypothetical protein [Myxococcota bacterium]
MPKRSGDRVVVDIAIEDQDFQAIFSRLPDGSINGPSLTGGSSPERRYRIELETEAHEAGRAFGEQRLGDIDALLPTALRLQTEEALRTAGVPRERLWMWDGVTLFLDEGYTEFHYTGQEAIADKNRRDFGLDIGHPPTIRIERAKGLALRAWLDGRNIRHARP